MKLSERWWRLRYLTTLLKAGGWRDLQTCLYLASCTDWEDGAADPVSTARDELSYMAQDIG